MKIYFIEYKFILYLAISKFGINYNLWNTCQWVLLLIGEKQWRS